MISLTIDLVTDSFPNPSIVKIEGKPSYNTIKHLEDLLIENASSVQSELRGGNYSYLGLVLKPIKYSTLTGVAFALHWNPGTMPVFLPNPTQLQIAQVSEEQ